MDEKLKQRENELIEKVSRFCDKHLDDECKRLSVKMVKRLGRLDNVPYKRGDLKNWAAGVIYALAQTSFLFDKSFKPYTTSTQICRFFNTKKTTTGNKARQIRDLLNLEPADEEFSTAYVLKNSGFLRTYGKGVKTRSLRGSENGAMIGAVVQMLRRK